MSKKNILNNYLIEKENIFFINIRNIFEPKVGIFKILDYDLNLNERQVKFEKYDYVLCEDCNQKIENFNFICDECYKRETDLNGQNRLKYGICKICFKSNTSLGCCKIFETSDYDLNLKEREKKYKDYNHILCEKCNQEINKYYYYCTYCCYRETDKKKQNRMKYGLKFGILLTSDCHSLNLKKRKEKYNDYDIIICEECNQEIDKQNCYCKYCYNRETDNNKKDKIRYGLNFGILDYNDYNLNFEERKKKYKNFDVIICEECNKEILFEYYYYYCYDCYHKETDINRKSHIKYGLKFGIFKTSDYDLNLEKRKVKYKDFGIILCEECNQEINRQEYYCYYCYDRETDINRKSHIMYGLKFGIFKTSDYDLNLKKRKVKYKDFGIILCEECNQEINRQEYYCYYCYYRETDGNKQNRIRHGLNFGIFKTLDYDLNFEERNLKYKDFDVILCEKCKNIFSTGYYYCTICYRKEKNAIRQNHMRFGLNFGIFNTLDYDLNMEKRKAKYKDFSSILCGCCGLFIDKQYYYCSNCYNKEVNINRRNYLKYELNFGIFNTLDYDLNFEERKVKYKDFGSILCEKCNLNIDKKHYYCEYCFKKESDINKQNHMKYGLNFGIFNPSDYDLNLEERKAKYKDFYSILCEKCKQEIDKQYYYCLVCYNKERDINQQNHMRYGLKFRIFKITDYDLNLNERIEKYKNFKVILCEKCNQEIDKQYYYCKYCYSKETDHSKKIRMKCVFKTGILKISDYDLSIKEKQTKFENYDSIKCEKCNCEIINFDCYRCDKCYFKADADKYEQRRMTFGLCKYCSEINTQCNCLPSLNQLLREFENFNEINESKVNDNNVLVISDYDLNEDDRREKYKDYNYILCEKCNKIFSYDIYCHDCDNEKKQTLKKLQFELQICENFYNELYEGETNKLKKSYELQYTIKKCKYIYSNVNHFTGIYLQIKKAIEHIMWKKKEFIKIKQTPEICFHKFSSYCDCYNKETDINEKKRMEFGRCKECLRIHEDLNGCLSCNSKRFQRDFNKWTSGNEDIDRLIQENQLSVRRNGLLEWISYDKFSNVNYIAEGGFAKVYSATWIDGQIKKWSQLSNSWRKNGSTTVALKVLNNSENISEDFLNEVRI
jgi:hypothetical protein